MEAQPVVIQPVRTNPIDPLALILGIASVILAAIYVVAAVVVLFTDNFTNEGVRRLLDLSSSTSQAIPFLALGAHFSAGPLERVLGRVALLGFLVAILLLALNGQIDFGQRYGARMPGF